MENLCFIASRSVVCMSKDQLEFSKCILYRELDDLFPKKLLNLQVGVNPRVWLLSANPLLRDYITDQLGEDQWYRDLTLLSQLSARRTDPLFIEDWLTIKTKNKIRLSNSIT